MKMDCVEFTIEEAEFMARFLAELIRQGIRFHTERNGNVFYVVFTGGC